jgi:sulfhydrogenase subunit beta (sulfur reductase)
MSGQLNNMNDNFTITPNDLQALFDYLSKIGYQILGPTISNGAIVIDEITSISNLPRGWTDEQGAANYHLSRRNDNALFGYSLGPQSWKKYLFPPKKRLWTAEREKAGFQLQAEPGANQKMAFIGVRPCEIRALEVLDKVLEAGKFSDPVYVAKRANTLIVTINCERAGGTCFCASMGSGPKATSGFDLALTEVSDNKADYVVVETGSETGAGLLKAIKAKKSSAGEIEAAQKITDKVTQSMGRQLDTKGLKELLDRNNDNIRWDETAKKCLTCGNCTLVCPTCFCSTVEDITDLTGKRAERWQRWDSCFTMDFSYIHGGSIRPSTKARYRQWMTHKLANWVEQFGTMGCVGCGRCITWCPAAIDITEEAQAIRDTERTNKTTILVKEGKDGNN